ncbi:hypothetical protein Tco_0089268 [Tanacetum coccineum]
MSALRPSGNKNKLSTMNLKSFYVIESFNTVSWKSCQGDFLTLNLPDSQSGLTGSDGMSVVYVLTTPILEDGEDAIVEQLRKRAKWDNDDYVCRGLILNGMSDPLFDIYQNVESSKEL